MLGNFTDERTDVMGAPINIEAEKFGAMCGAAALSPLVTVDVVLVDAAEGAPPHGQIAKADDNPDQWRVALPVSDRLEFSEKSVERINRNLLHCLRHVSQMINVESFFPNEKVQRGVVGMAGQAFEADAYLCEKTVKEQPDAYALLPGAVTLATDPEVKAEGESTEGDA